MIVIDVNLLLYAYVQSTAHHAAARKWLTEVMSGQQLIGLPWQSVAAFLRVSTHSRLGAVTPHQAASIVDTWLEQPLVRLLVPGERHWALLRQMMFEGQARGPLVTDAQLAALTVEHGGVLHTTDRDFARFPGLRWTNPLV